MRYLSISLIVAMISAIAGLGMGLSTLYEAVGAHSNEQQTELTAYKNIGRNLIQSLDPAKNIDSQLNSFLQISGLSSNLQALDHFPLPPELMPAFLNGEPLALQSEQNIALHFYWPATNQVLSLTGLVAELPKAANTWLRLSMTLVFYLGVLGISLAWLTPLVRRLIRLRNAATAFGQGRLETRIATHRRSYLADIEREFNQMADRIQSLIADNKLLSRAVSHDLKTPLARLRFGIDLLADSKEESTRDKYLQRLEYDLSEMENLVGTLLSYARLDEGSISLDFKRIDLQRFVQDLFTERDDDYTVEFNSDQNITKLEIDADTRYLSMLVNNIVSNAIKYSRSKVIVSIYKDTDQIMLTIEDDGPGIDVSEREHVLKPFYRVKLIDTPPPVDGYGMGLAIAARIAQWHHARLVIDESKKLGGAQIQVCFPAMLNSPI